MWHGRGTSSWDRSWGPEQCLNGVPEGMSRVPKTMGRLVWKPVHKVERRRTIGNVQQNRMWAISGYWLGLDGERGPHIHTCCHTGLHCTCWKQQSFWPQRAYSHAHQNPQPNLCLPLGFREPRQVKQTGGKDPHEGFLNEDHKKKKSPDKECIQRK